MANKKIAGNSTIATVLGTLTNAEQYVTGVFHHMHECFKKQGSAYVRIGVQGTGKSPHYRVEYDVTGVSHPVPIYDAFDGRNHNVLVDEDQLMDRNWSSARMTREEFFAVMQTVKDAKHPKKT